MTLPAHGVDREQIFARFDEMAVDDVRWRDGRAFTLAYSAGAEVLEVAEEAYRRFSGRERPEHRCVPQPAHDAGRRRRHRPRRLGGADTAGFDDHGRHREPAHRGEGGARPRRAPSAASTPPRWCCPPAPTPRSRRPLPTSTSRVGRDPGRPDWRADVAAMADAVDDDTVLVVGSAPQYPQGVIDAIAGDRRDRCRRTASTATSTRAWAASSSPTSSASASRSRRGTSACPGSRASRSTCTSTATRPRGRRRAGPPRHAPAPLPDVRHRQLARRRVRVVGHARHEVAAAPSPPRGPCSTTSATTATCASPRSPGGPCLRLADAVATTPGCACWLRPTPRSWRSPRTIPDLLDVVAVATALRGRGWYVDHQGPPASLHCTVNAVHDATIDAFVADLRTVTGELFGVAPTGAAAAPYATDGSATT